MRVGTLPMHNPNLWLDSGCIIRNHVNGRRYRVGKLLGMGGFGAAYKVLALGKQSPDDSRKYCLKVTANPESWCREAYFGDLLRNVAGVIQVYEAFAWVHGSEDQLPIYCLITELADGSDLASWLERNPGAWKESRVRREIIKLLRTIGRLHERGAVHRDLTPSNVFVTSQKSLKVGDFGIAAHPFGKRGVAADVFAQWLAPPGMAEGEMTIWQPADDVYHLGQLFAMLILGSAQSKLMTRDIKNLSCSPEAKSVIQRCIGLRKKRFPTAAAMLVALENQEQPRRVIVRSLEGRRVVFTGKLSVPRAEATRMVRKAGGIVQKAVCHSTDVIVVGQDSPFWKAEKKGQKLLDWDFERERDHHIAYIKERRFMHLVS